MKGQITMSKKDLSRVPVLERAVEKSISTKEGAKIIGVSARQFRRLKNNYMKNGAEGIIHKSRGRKSNRAIPKSIKELAIKVIQKDYPDFGPTLAREKLLETHFLDLSVETLRKEMIAAGIWIPKLLHKTNIHQMRERRSQEGELIQADGSPHPWFEDRGPECDLLVYIDDATGKLMWLEFAKSESTKSYMKATTGYVTTHGRPLSLYVDKHSVFRVNTSKVNSASLADNTGETQFGRAMRELDIELIFACSPQAKGRVERVNQTLQDRLVKELRLLKINSIEEGNKYLPTYIQKFNLQFSVKPKSNINAHRPILLEHNLEEIFCLKETRVVTKDLTAHYKDTTYRIKIDPKLGYTLRRAQILVMEDLDGNVELKYKDKILEYSVINVQPRATVCDAKMVNKKVEELKKKQGQNFQFNLFGRTFLLWRKADISTLG